VRHDVRARAVALVGVLLLAACGSDAGHRASTATPVTDAQGQTIVTDAAGSTVAPRGTTPGGGTAPEAPSETSRATSAATSSQASNGDADRTLALDSTSTVGSFAPGLLRADRSSGIVVEVRAADGAALRQSSLAHLSSVLGQVSGKPISGANGPAIRQGARAWTADELRVEADAPGTLRQPAGPDGLAVLRVLAVHGTYGGDQGVLGVSVRADTAVIFSDQVAASGSVLIGSAGIESAVVAHEAGHLLGLVDLYLHTGRQDPDHPGHSTNSGSVMYWAVESSLVGDVLKGGPPQEFDSADLADLAAIKGGA
jgi:hypothetical protein